MNTSQQKFAERLRAAIEKAGYKTEAAVLEREFNQRYYGKGVTLHGVNKWLKGQAIPRWDKIETLAKWLRIPPEELTFGLEIKTTDQGRPCPLGRRHRFSGARSV